MNEKVNRTRKNAHYFYLSDAEEIMVKERMKLANSISFSDYARHCLINTNFIIKKDDKEMKGFSIAVNKVCLNIKQIIYALNKIDSYPKDSIDELKDLNETVIQYMRYLLTGTPF